MSSFNRIERERERGRRRDRDREAENERGNRERWIERQCNQQRDINYDRYEGTEKYRRLYKR